MTYAGKMTISRKAGSWPVSINRLLTLGILAVMFVVFSAFAHNFFTVRNVLNLLVQTSTYTIVAIGAAFVMIVGGIDFSLSVVVMLSGHVVVWLAVAGVPIWLSMIVAASLGGITGFVNGFAVARLRIPSFLATMGTAMIAGGTLGVVAGYIHLTKIPESLGDLGNVPVFRIYSHDAVGANTIVFPGISWIVIIMAFLALLFQFVATKTVIGRHAYLVGSNQEAARFSGINVRRVKLAAFMLAGLLAGLVGVLLASRLVATPGASGGYEIIGMTCAMIGGASLSGGTGSIGGTVIGSFLMSTLAMGLTMLNTSGPTVFLFFAALVVLVAVYLDQIRNSDSPYSRSK